MSTAWSLSLYLAKWVQVPVFMGSCPIFGTLEGPGAYVNCLPSLLAPTPRRRPGRIVMVLHRLVDKVHLRHPRPARHRGREHPDHPWDRPDGFQFCWPFSRPACRCRATQSLRSQSFWDWSRPNSGPPRPSFQCVHRKAPLTHTPTRCSLGHSHHRHEAHSRATQSSNLKAAR